MTATDTTVASTILAQLGGTRFLVMTGAKNLIAGANQLTFRLPGAGFCKNGINCVRVTLNGTDTYTMEFLKIRGMKVTTVETVEGLYDDMLRPVFTRATGLVTNL